MGRLRACDGDGRKHTGSEDRQADRQYAEKTEPQQHRGSGSQGPSASRCRANGSIYAKQPCCGQADDEPGRRLTILLGYDRQIYNNHDNSDRSGCCR